MILESKLPADIFHNDTHYFFSMLSDRFTLLNHLWQDKLSKKYNKVFKPIYVLPFRHNKSFEEENYIVINEKIRKLRQKTGRTDLIELIYPEDINKQFSESGEINKLIDTLVLKQGTVYILGFTTVWLNMPNPNVVVLGPDSTVATRYDDKAMHIRTFKELGFEVVDSKIFSKYEYLLSSPPDYPFFISATYSSGGIESKAVHNSKDLNAFYANLRDVNQHNAFIVSSLLTDIILAPNTTALVTSEGNTVITCISDQILNGNAYMGNTYPSKASSSHLMFMEYATKKVGNLLSKQGYKGLFGLDFLITSSGKCYPTDLNPRRQGGYYCNVLSSPTDIIDLEISTIFGDPIPSVHTLNFKPPYSWGHSKLTPTKTNSKIIKELNHNGPEMPFGSIGSSHSAIYYPKNYTVVLGNPGFYVTTDNSAEIVSKRLQNEVQRIISTHYS